MVSTTRNAVDRLLDSRLDNADRLLNQLEQLSLDERSRATLERCVRANLLYSVKHMDWEHLDRYGRVAVRYVTYREERK